MLDNRASKAIHSSVEFNEKQMAISLSETAAQHVRTYIEQRGHGLGIRLLVETSECSGMAYRLFFVDEEEEDDIVFDSHDARIYVDPKSLVYLEGAEIGYYSQDGVGEGFFVTNPNAKNECGCGGSFSI